MSMSTRLGDALRSGRNAVREFEQSQGESDANAIPDDLEHLQSIGGFIFSLNPEDVFSLNPEDVANAAARLRKFARRRDEFIVLVTDQTEVSLFQLDGIVTEYVKRPEAASTDMPASDAELYLQRRLDLIRAKWNLRQILLFGDVSYQVADLWRDAAGEFPKGFFTKAI